MPTPTTSSNDNAAATTTVQQAPRSPSEFQFAHRLLRKLVQDSTFFPAETSRREYVWFPPRLHNDHDNDADANAIDGAALNNDDADENDSNNDDGAAIVPTSEEENEEEDDGNNISALSLGTTTSTINGSSDHNHQEEEVQESHIIHKLQQHQQQEQQQQQQQLQQTTRRRRRRTVSTPLFLDYCLRSHTADINTRRGSLDNNNYSLRYNNNNNNNNNTNRTTTATQTATANSNDNNNRTSSQERGGHTTTNNGGERATSPTHSFGSSKYSCNSTTNITSNTATDSYHHHHHHEDMNNGNCTSPVSVCSSGVCSGNVSSGGGGGDDVAIHPTVGVRVGSMMRELPFQRTDVEGAGRETKKENGVKEQSHQPSVGVLEGVEAGQQQQKRGGYSRTLTRQSSFSDRIVPNQTNIEEETPTSSVVVGQSTSTAATAMTSSSSSAPTDTATTKVAPTTTTTASSSSPSRAPTPIEETHRVYSIHEKELEFGTILGSGGFGQVRLVRIRGNHNANAMVSSSADDNVGVVSSATPDADVATKEETTTNNNESNGNNKYYAMKYLSPSKTSPPPSSSTGEEDGEGKQSIHYVTKFERAIADLTMEARFLSVLSHEHIVKLWFVSEGRLETVFNCDNDQDGNSDEEEDGQQQQQQQQQYHYQHGYFLLLDALHETLHQRISHTYIPQVIDTPLRIYQTNKKSYSNNTRIAKVQLAKRLSSLKSVALALKYLHDDCNLIYRDIKPSNIGFYRRYDGGSCSCGNAERELLLDRQQRQQQSSSSAKCTCSYTDIPKLFDFGLAKELKPRYHKKHPSHNPNDPPTFRLTCATGSRRYMSPEVALREPYNHKADVYSFGMVLYQISALVAPFHALDMKNHEQVVAREGLRPDVSIPSKESSVRRTRDFKRHYSNEKSRSKKSLMLSKRARCVWPEALNALIAECWDGDMRKRPEMREVVERLDACIETLNVHPSPS